jgi:hypothetical protein
MRLTCYPSRRESYFLPQALLFNLTHFDRCLKHEIWTRWCRAGFTNYDRTCSGSILAGPG